MATTLTPASINQMHQNIIDNGGSERTARAYKSDLMLFWKYLNAVSMNIPMTWPDVADPKVWPRTWLNDHRSGGPSDEWSVSTLQRRATAIRYWCRWAGVDNPLQGYKIPPRVPPTPHPLEGGLADVFEMIQAVGHATDKQLAIALGGLCGLRVGEIISLEWKDWDTGLKELTVVGKGDRTRIVPISGYTDDLLHQWWLAPSTAPTGRILPWSDAKARRTIRDAGKLCGMKVASHDLRATFATHVYEDTKDIRLVQMLLGHTNIHTTEAYVGVSKAAMRAAVGSMGP